MPDAIVTSVVLIILMIGFCTILSRRYRISKRVSFAKEYLSNIVDWVNSSYQNIELYDWLITNSHRMQSEMGDQGIAHTFQPPYRQVIYRSWPIILNAIPEMNQMHNQGIHNSLMSYAHLVRDALLRHIGHDEHLIVSIAMA